MTIKQLDYLSRVLKLLTDPTRLRILLLLQERDELTGTEISHLLQINQGAAAKKLSKMAAFNLVRNRREGQFIYYSLVDPLVIQRELIMRLACHLTDT